MGDSAPRYSVTPSRGGVNVSADLLVRPDVVCVPFVIAARGGDVGAGLAAAKIAADDLKAGGAVRIDDIDVVADPHQPATVTVRGVVEAALPNDDAFVRGGVVAGLVAALAGFATPDENKKIAVKAGSPTLELHVGIGAPAPAVKDVELHRQVLLDGWAARVSALQKSVGGDGVDLANCSAPGAVQLVGGTLEKVGLNLPISCSIAVKSVTAPTK